MMQGADAPLVETAHIDVVSEAIHNMPESMQEVLLAIFHEQVPYSELGRRLGCSKTQAWRKAQAALSHITRLIGNHPILIERYNVFSNWNEASWMVIDSLDRMMPREAHHDIIEWATRQLADRVRKGQELEGFLFNAIATEAVQELKHRNLWEPHAFHAVLCGKQHDYGHDNINAFGLIGVAVRINDKYARLRNLTDRNEPLNEPLLDSWLDLIGYSVIAEMLINNTFNLELEAA